MTKEEFAEELNMQGFAEDFSDKDYEIIEAVYTFHPSISETEGKKQIAYLFGTFGMRLIKDMYPTAQKAQEYEDQIRAARNKYAELQKQFSNFSMGWDY